MTTLGQSLETEIASCVGAQVVAARGLTGGDINDAYAVSLGDGRNVFVKTRADAPARMFATEAAGLEWLREANALRLPQVIGFGERFLALELLESSAPAGDFDVVLGQGLARLHRFGASEFGLGHDNFIGTLEQANAPCATWTEFYRERRLLPQIELALRAGSVPSIWTQRFERLLASLPERIPHEPPHRLHGDFWGGNLHVGPRGEPCLIDPAAYAGNREVDLALMRLFGGFSQRVFAAYNAEFPLLPGADERVELYQLYPLLVHVNLFGGSYVGSVERALASLR